MLGVVEIKCFSDPFLFPALDAQSCPPVSKLTRAFDRWALTCFEAWARGRSGMSHHPVLKVSG